MGGFLFEFLDFIVLALVIIGVLRKISSLFRAPKVNIRTATARPSTSNVSAGHQGEMVRDPVCGIFVSTELPHQLRQGKDVVHFCSRECLEKYQKASHYAAS